jgi:hypothetical protein
MQRKTKKIILALVVIGAVAAGGAAFTAANTVPTSVAGYGQNTVTGATLDSVHHNLSVDGIYIETTDLVLHGDHTTEIVKAGFGKTVGGVVNEDLTTCTNGVLDGSGNTPVTCDWKAQLPGAPGPGHLNDGSATTFSVAVTSITP